MATHAFPDGHLPPVPLESLPEAVRTLVVARAADVLPLVAVLPPSLKRVAAFAPARRARLGGSAISAALADDDLRGHVGTQAAARPARSDDPAERAALAWLVRDEGWVAELDEALRLIGERDEPGEETRQSDVERLRRKVAAAEQTAREARAKARTQVEEYKQENATLRRKLGESRSAERLAREAAEESERSADVARARVETLEAAQDKDVRRLRERIEQLEGEHTARRRTTREEKDDATLRARLLLDTVIDAATGLRRELGMRAVPGAPADRVEAGLAEAEPDARSPVGTPGPRSPALLEQLLGMPRARLIVDGYNVSKTAWPQLSLEEQRRRLLRDLAPLVARTRVETTVVFDAHSASTRPVVNAPRGVKVVFSPAGVIADDVIRDLVAAEPVGRPLVVVSDDGEVARDSQAAGARALGSDILIGLLSRG